MGNQYWETETKEERDARESWTGYQREEKDEDDTTPTLHRSVPGRTGFRSYDPKGDFMSRTSDSYFFGGMGIGTVIGGVTPIVACAVASAYSESFAKVMNDARNALSILGMGGFLGATVGSLIGCYLGAELFELLKSRIEKNYEEGERKYKERVERERNSSVTTSSTETPIEHFLTGDQELDEVLCKDDKTVRKLGVTHKQITDRIEYFANVARGSYRRNYLSGEIFDDLYEIKVHLFTHPQKCPLDEHEQECGDMNVRVRNLKLGEELFFPALITHSITHHRYYGGRKLHRVDPKRAVRILDIRRVPQLSHK